MSIPRVELDAIGERFDSGHWTSQDVQTLFGEIAELRRALDDTLPRRSPCVHCDDAGCRHCNHGGI